METTSIVATVRFLAGSDLPEVSTTPDLGWPIGVQEEDAPRWSLGQAAI